MSHISINRQTIPQETNQVNSEIPKEKAFFDKISRVIQWILHYLTFGLIDKPKPHDYQMIPSFQEFEKNCEGPPQNYAGYLYPQLFQPFKMVGQEIYDQFMQPKGDSVYIDMGRFYGNYVITQCMNWQSQPPSIDQQKLDTFLTGLFNHLKASETKSINLSFAQIEDIQKLLAGQGGAADDTITQIFKDNYSVGTTGENFLKYFIQKANENGIQGDLSFGGAIANGPNMKLPGDPVNAAKDLVAFMKEYNFDSTDFDVEGYAASQLMTQNSPQDAVTFFQTLHSELSAAGKTSLLTVAGALSDGPEGILKPLFENFNSMFDGVNLMLYSNSQYYLDATNPTWGISEWIKYVPPEKINTGFYDAIQYTNPAASAGKKYNIPTGLKNGQAAAYIYKQLQEDLAQINPKDVPLGQPFFWTDDPTKITSNDFMKDFMDYLGN